SFSRMIVLPSICSGFTGIGIAPWFSWVDSSSRAGGTTSSCWADKDGAAANRAVQRAKQNFWFIRTGFDFLGTDENGAFFRKNKISGQNLVRQGIPCPPIT